MMKKRSSTSAKRPSLQDLSPDLIPITGKGSFAIILHNLLTPEECSFLIDRAEKEGFDRALIHGPHGREILNQDIRRCGRCIIDDENLGETIFQRIVNAVKGTPHEKKILHLSFHDRGPVTAVGLNERFRFLKYSTGQFFAPHQDVPFVRGPEHGTRAGEKSFVTVQIYLNDQRKGGATRFLCRQRYYDVSPRMGSVLIFDHDLLHEGCKVTGGIKYSVRTDIMYELPQMTSPPLSPLSETDAA